MKALLLTAALLFTAAPAQASDLARTAELISQYNLTMESGQEAENKGVPQDACYHYRLAGLLSLEASRIWPSDKTATMYATAKSKALKPCSIYAGTNLESFINLPWAQRGPVLKR